MNSSTRLDGNLATVDKSYIPRDQLKDVSFCIERPYIGTRPSSWCSTSEPTSSSFAPSASPQDAFTDGRIVFV